MSPAWIAAPVIGGLIVFWTCIALGKRVGDELASWVVAHDEDDTLVPDFGVEWVRTNDGHRPSLRAYRYYAARYRQLRRSRGEDVRLARRFEAIYFTQYIACALAFAATLILFVLFS